MTVFQKDRIYSLIVGNQDDAVEINNLQIKFEVTKTSSNKDKKNTASVQIYNLSEDRRKKLEEEYVQVSLLVGYTETDLINLFQGQVNNIYSTKLSTYNSTRQGTDLVTTLNIDELYTVLNGTIISNIVPAGSTVRDVLQTTIRNIPEITRQEMSGEGIERTLPDGYPISGTPRQVLDKLSRDYDLEWQIDAGVLYVSDVGDSFSSDTTTVFSIGQFSGLIDRPEYINEESKRIRRQAEGKNPKKLVKKNSIRCKILLNPSILAGSIVYLDFETMSGYYKVDEVKHEGDFRGDTWYSTLMLTERVE